VSGADDRSIDTGAVHRLDLAKLGADAEWLEADGLGGFASGTVAGVRTRRYHALLLAAVTPPTGRSVLVNGCEVWVETSAGTFPISTQYYAPGVAHPEGVSHLAKFEAEPWPRWTFRLPDGTEVVQEIVVPKGAAATLVAWRRGAGEGAAMLHVKPLLSGRDAHALHHASPEFPFACEAGEGRVAFGAYPGLPHVVARHNGRFDPAPEWFRSFQYEEERRRGLDFVEDLAAPGEFHFDLAAGDAVLLLSAGEEADSAVTRGEAAARAARRVRTAETRRRAAFPSRLHRAADAYLVGRGTGATIVAGYPWFTDWGRDTFIALRGLCLAGGRLDVAGKILLEWAGAVSEGMLPNRFADAGAPEYNAVDASLWYVVAAGEWLDAMAAARKRVAAATRRALVAAAQAILEGYARGTRYGIRMDSDGLIASGEPGVQLTWMDAKVGDWVVTPRTGKAVEIQALWINALDFGARSDARWAEVRDRARSSFEARFWNEAAGCLYDVVDVDHRPGIVDPTLRPNQLFAVGGLPLPLIEGAKARGIVDAVEARLWTPLGLRSLSPGERGYVARYEGGVLERDGAYHQGTVWPWLIGAFVEAWLRVRGGGPEAKVEARRRFVAPLMEHLDAAGLGHVSEIADAEAPFTPRGCPFQAWSVGELLRLEAVVLAGAGDAAAKPAGVSEGAPPPPSRGLTTAVASVVSITL
jgi:predicted glycogen debranching enzyme